jgi:hypothetical protein
VDRRTRGLLVLLLLAAVGLQACGTVATQVVPLERAAVAEPTTTTMPPPPTTTAPPTTAAPPAPAPAPARASVVRPPATAAPRRVAPKKPAPASVTGGVSAYVGLGTWVDVFDWTNSYTHGNPTVGPAEVDRMASLGVQTLYIQAARADSPSDVVEPDGLRAIIQRAHTKGIRVVVWYLPTFTDVNADLRRLLAISGLGVEGLAVDIESREVADPAERSRRLVDLSDRLRAALPGRTLGGIVFPPTGMEVINPGYWPGFPWGGIAHDYDVWLPMAYWTGRSQDSGWHDGYRYTLDNVQRLRNDIHQPAAPVHPIGGIADGVTAAEVDGMVRAVAATASIGGSLYDFHTSAAELWPHLTPLRR